MNRKVIEQAAHEEITKLRKSPHTFSGLANSIEASVIYDPKEFLGACYCVECSIPLKTRYYVGSHLSDEEIQYGVQKSIRRAYTEFEAALLPTTNFEKTKPQILIMHDGMLWNIRMKVGSELEPISRGIRLSQAIAGLLRHMEAP